MKISSKILIICMILLISAVSMSIAYSHENKELKTGFQNFKESAKETYGLDVTEKDYENIKQGFTEMENDLELYGTPHEPKIKIAYCDHVFVGRVTKHIGNFQPNYSGSGYPIPYNTYDVEIFELIKGPALEKMIELKQYGGYYTEKSLKEEIGEKNISSEAYPKDENGYYGFMYPSDSILKEGEYYLFITTTQDDGYCTIFHPEYRILLEDYEEKGSDSFEEILIYKKLVESGIKDYFRFRMIANEEIETRTVLG